MKLLVVLAMASCGAEDLPLSVMSGLAEGRLVVSEVMSNPVSADAPNEWIEIYNPRQTDYDAPLTVRIVWNGGQRQDEWLIDHIVIPSGEYRIVGAREGYSNVVTYNTIAHPLPNKTFRLMLVSDFDLDTITVPSSIEDFSWGFGGDYGPDAIANDNELLWCWLPAASATTTAVSTPGDANQACPTGQQYLSRPQCRDVDWVRDVRLPSAGQVSMTEVLADPKVVPDSDGEWIEIIATGVFDWNAVQLRVGTNDAQPLYRTSGDDMLECKSSTVSPVLVVAADSSQSRNGGIGSSIEGLPSLSNSGVTVALRSYDQILDQWAIGASKAGVSLVRGAHDCEVQPTFGEGDYGSPGTTNSICTIVESTIVVGDILISEFMANPEGTESTSTEWIELHNTTGADVSLASCYLLDDGTDMWDLSTINLPANSFVVVSEASNDPVNGAIQWDDTVLSNTADEIVLQCGEGEISRVTYASGDITESVSWQYDGANWCISTDFYDVENIGSPGSINVACP